MGTDDERLVCEFWTPGTSLVLDNREHAIEIESLLYGIRAAFADTVMSLILFQSQLEAEATVAKSAARTRAEELRKETRVMFVPGMSSADYERAENHQQEGVIRRLWAEGIIPETFTRKLVSIYAKSFIYAADSIGKMLVVLQRLPSVPEAAKSAAATYYDTFPSLKQIRDSAQHPEDRVRGKRRQKKREEDIELKASAILGPDPLRGLFIDVLVDGNFTTTMADGHPGTIAMTAETIASVRNHIEQVVNAFSWTGSPEYFPKP